MPTKNVYVAEADLPLYEQAQSLAGGSLSTAIAQALRQFVAHHQTGDDFEEVTVAVSTPYGVTAKKRFSGRLMAKCRLPSADANRLLTYQVFLTPKEKWAVHWKDVPALWYQPQKHPTPPRWDFDWDDTETQASWQAYTHQWTDYAYHLDVYDSWEEAQQHLPAEVIQRVGQTLSGGPPDVEILDI